MICPQLAENPWFATSALATEGGVSQPDAGMAEAAELARAKVLSDALVQITASFVAGAATASAQQIFDVILAQAAEALGCESAQISVRDGDGWIVPYTWGILGEIKTQLFAIAPQADWVEKNRRVLAYGPESAQVVSAEIARQSGIRARVMLPLMAHDQVLGVLALNRHTELASFMPSEIQFVEHLAELAALALENAQLHEAETRQRDELARRVEELQTLVELVPLGIAIARDPECRRIDANPANARMLGIPAGANASLSTGEHETQATFRTFHDGRELPADELPMQVAAARGLEVRDMYLDIVRADGQTVTMLAFAVPLFDANGKSRGAIGAFVDQTEQRRLRAEAEAASRTLEALMEFIPEGLTIVDAPEIQVRYTSRYGEDLSGGPYQGNTAGESAAQWVSYESDGVTPIPEDDLPIMRAVRHGETVCDKELIRVNAQGRRQTLLCSAGPIRDREGKVTGGIIAWRDVAVLKEAQEALRQSEERYRLLFTTMNEGFFLGRMLYDEAGLPSDYLMLDVNPAYERLSGLARQAVLGKTARQIYQTIETPWVADFGRVAQTGDPAYFETYGGLTERWYEVSAYTPGPDLVAVVFTDVTERRRAEEQLRQAEARARDIIRLAPSGIYEVDLRTGRFRSVNDTMCEILGYSREELLTMTALDLLDDAGQVRFPDRMRRMLARETVDASVEYLVKRRDGGVIYALLSTSITYRDGQPDGVFVIAHDVTESRRAGEALRQQQELHQQLAAELEVTLSSIADGLVIYDAGGKITHMNPTAQDILGYSPAEQQLSMSERVGWLSAVPADGEYGGPETLPVYRAQHGETVQGSVWIMTHHSADPLIPNRQRWISTSAAPIRDAKGRQIGTVASFTDVTELHQALEALRTARDELEQRVRERTAELEAANAQLVRKEATLQYQANVLEHIHDAVIATDTNLRITAWNHGAEEQYGWKAEEVIGAYVLDVVASEISAEQRTAANRAVLETGHWRGEVLHRRRDGTPIPTEATTIVMRDAAEQTTGYVSVHRDITERRLAEEALRQQKERREILHQIDRSILAAMAPAEIAQTAAGKILQMAQAMRVSVVLTDFATQEGEILAAMGPEAAVHRAGRRVPLSGYPMIERVRAGEVAQIEDFARALSGRAAKPGRGAACWHPLVDTGAADRRRAGDRSAVHKPGRSGPAAGRSGGNGPPCGRLTGIGDPQRPAT